MTPVDVSTNEIVEAVESRTIKARFFFFFFLFILVAVLVDFVGDLAKGNWEPASSMTSREEGRRVTR